MIKHSTKALIAGAAILATVAVTTGAASACSSFVEITWKKVTTTHTEESYHEVRRGWGYGDKNHEHTGPPGRSVYPGHED